MVVADVCQQRRFLFTELANLLFVGIKTVYCCAEPGEAGTAYEADIARTNYRNVHN
jgi:hypothetical protein